MIKAKHLLAGLMVIVTIAVVDRYLIVELQPSPPDMVWIDGADFASEPESEFTNPDVSVEYQLAGFWIDKSVVSKADFQAFVAKTGYAPTLQPAIDSHSFPDDMHKPITMNHGFTLRDSMGTIMDNDSAQYISHKDALAYCNWKGLTISSADQSQFADKWIQVDEGELEPSITVYASQPLSDLSGLRCVKIPEWSDQQGYNAR